LLLGFSHQTGVRVAEVGFLLIPVRRGLARGRRDAQPGATAQG